MYQDAQQFEDPIKLDKTNSKRRHNLTAKTKKVSQRLMQARYLMLQARHWRRNLLFTSHAMTFDRRFEKLLFVSSKGPAKELQLDFLANSEKEDFISEPMPVKSVKWALDILDTEDFHGTFVDVKAGRGQALLIAAARPFDKIIGIETSSKIRDDAAMNVAQFPRSYMRCRNIECIDLAPEDIPVPAGRAVFFFNRPRHIGDLQKQINQISKAYKESPRRFMLITMAATPQVDEIIMAAGIFQPATYSKLTSLKHNLFSPHAIRAYRTLV